MSAFFLTKVVTVHEPEGQFGKGTGLTRTVNIQPMSAQRAFDRFGVSLERSYQLFDTADGQSFYRVGGRVMHGEIEYTIKGVMDWDDDLPTSHTHVLLEKMNGT